MDANENRETAPAPVVDGASAEMQSFRGLLARVVEGCPGAAEQLQEQYGRHIKRVVRYRLPQRLRAKFDSLDFVQDVWASFYRQPGREFNEPEHLIAYLTRMAQHKVAQATKELQTAKRDVSREEPLEIDADKHTDENLVAKDATPSEAAIGRELWEQMLEDQPAAYRVVLTMLRDGRSQAEVAERLKLSRRTVHRILSRALEKVKL
jgi:RNA polymerase sigma factor (sigma-70 family)